MAVTLYISAKHVYVECLFCVSELSLNICCIICHSTAAVLLEGRCRTNWPATSLIVCLRSSDLWRVRMVSVSRHRNIQLPHGRLHKAHVLLVGITNPLPPQGKHIVCNNVCIISRGGGCTRFSELRVDASTHSGNCTRFYLVLWDILRVVSKKVIKKDIPPFKLKLYCASLRLVKSH
jgi:hypothetical protein